MRGVGESSAPLLSGVHLTFESRPNYFFEQSSFDELRSNVVYDHPPVNRIRKTHEVRSEVCGESFGEWVSPPMQRIPRGCGSTQSKTPGVVTEGSNDHPLGTVTRELIRAALAWHAIHDLSECNAPARSDDLRYAGS